MFGVASSERATNRSTLSLVMMSMTSDDWMRQRSALSAPALTSFTELSKARRVLERERERRERERKRERERERERERGKE